MYYVKKENLCGGNIIIMYDYDTNEPIQEFYNASYACRALFKNNNSSKITVNLLGRSNKVFLPDKRKVYFKYKENDEKTN